MRAHDSANRVEDDARLFERLRRLTAQERDTPFKQGVEIVQQHGAVTRVRAGGDRGVAAAICSGPRRDTCGRRFIGRYVWRTGNRRLWQIAQCPAIVANPGIVNQFRTISARFKPAVRTESVSDRDRGRVHVPRE